MTAPVTAITGLPGNGKTLYSVCMIKEWAEKENRQVYYHGIEILDKQALPWEEFEDPKTWHKLPHGAIIVIDEAHKVFPVRPQGSKVPEHVEAIAELRHQGHNLVLITQHPMELDSAIRRRVGRHLHAVRRFGMQACALFEWPRCVENCDKTRKDAIRHEWSYNTKAFGWYKSAEIHTIKRKIPKKVFFLALAPVLIAFAIWYVYSIFTKQREPEKVAAASTSTAASASPGTTSAAPSPFKWFEDRTPRVKGLEHTAPVYDTVTQPVRAPFPAACIASTSKCQCYTQQGTRLSTTDEVCRGIAAGGFFVAWDTSGNRVEQHGRVNVAEGGTSPRTASLP